MPLKEVDPIKVEAGEPSEKLQLEDMNDAFAQISHFGDGRISKMEVDYTAETDKQLNEANLKQKVFFM